MILLFDLDSTLCTIEWLSTLAEKKWLDTSFSQITERSMNGDIDFDESFSQRLMMLEATELDQERLWNIYINNITEWMEDLISLLKEQWHQIWILTYSFYIAAQKIWAHLWIQKHIFWNKVIRPYKKEVIQHQGTSMDILTSTYSKAYILKHLSQTSQEKIGFIWDGYQDMISWQQEADIFIWFWWNVIREKVENWSTYFAKTSKEILDYILLDTK